MSDLVRITGFILASASVSMAASPDFLQQVQPILRKKCIGCHGSALQSNGLRLDDRDAALRGSYSGAVIVAGDSAASKLFQKISSEKEGFRMPPAGVRLTGEEIEIVKNWIDGGAVWPQGAKPTVAAGPKSNHWSFQPVKRSSVPAVKDAAWVKSPIDAFVLARLEKEGAKPSEEASKTALLRRLSLDLTGLPPTPHEAAAFVSDQRPEAYASAVDRLLASPHYGERWARPWLDLAHYADSDGYEKDQVRTYAWRYRHWVIEALNRDMPFDRFTVEQLAGDLLPEATVEQRVATGFLRNTLTNREAGVDREEARFEQLVNRNNTVATTWLGLTVGCSQCHDHKYDPLSQRDYYRMLSYWEAMEETDIDAPLAGELGPYLAAYPAYSAKREKLLAEYEIPELMPLWEAKLREAIDHPGRAPEWDFALTSMKAMFDSAVKILKQEPSRRARSDQDRLTGYFVRRTGATLGLDKSKMDRFKELRGKLDEIEKGLPRLTQAQAMRHDADFQAGHIRIRGDWKQLGIPVEAGTPAVFGSPAGEKPDRLTFARWLVSRQNPLTARVFVNRAWAEFFGRGIVNTTEDFGIKGDRPTHPELLDWLASEFMDKGWSMKQLHRTIVMSATYRQSSNVRKDLEERDPENTLLARQARIRLSAETIRDAALFSGGLLESSIGGASVRPPQPAGVSELTYGTAKWAADTGPARYRRGLYVHFQRTSPYPMLMNFDEPDSTVSCTRRSRSNTPLQALNLLNDEVFFEAANGLAWRIAEEAPDGLSAKLDYAFLTTLGRKPADAERQRLAQYHDEQTRIFQKENSSFSPWLAVGRVLLNLDEFIVRE
ncbi:MAG: PSD1 domain-containing protein [Acidobacteriia bacterium]|nr:PSD1 domain-containing protein [Terriglobia bacterium]